MWGRVSDLMSFGCFPECLTQTLVSPNRRCTRCPCGVCVKPREAEILFSHRDVDGSLLQRLGVLSQQGVTPCESRQPRKRPHELFTNPSKSLLFWDERMVLTHATLTICFNYTSMQFKHLFIKFITNLSNNMSGCERP